MVAFTKAAGWSVLFWDWAFVSRRPSAPIQRDERGRLHSLNGPACEYAGGFGVYAVHGVRVPRYVIMEPTTISVEKIETERNAEVRRVMIERYGQARYLVDSGAVEIHRDDFGILYRKEIPNDEPLVMVKVVNSTPEADGSYKDYWLRCDPNCRPLLHAGFGDPQDLTARNAVAASFGLTGEEYEPEMQT